MIMLSRFYIDLHRSACHPTPDLSNLTISDLRFARVVGQLGETVTDLEPSSSLECIVTTDEYVFVDWEETADHGDGFVDSTVDQHVLVIA